VSIYWLRVGDTISIQGVTAIRSERTVNHAMTAVHTFTRFHLHLGNVGSDKRFTRFNIPIGAGTSHFAGIAKAKPVREVSEIERTKKSFLVVNR